MNRPLDEIFRRQVVSLLDMQELVTGFFVGVTVELSRLRDFMTKAPDKDEVLFLENAKNVFIPHVEKLLKNLESVNAVAAIAATKRLELALKIDPLPTMGQLSTALTDIESRFADHLEYVKLFVLQPSEIFLVYPAEKLLAFDGNEVIGFREKFPAASFEIEEAAKCFAFGRHTACVFHCMRIMEIGLRVLAKKLDIPNPVLANDRNWGNMLKSIKAKIDEKWPQKLNTHGTEGQKMEALYATLDAVKNPWRNATMHVEVIYAPHEAMHIMRCVGYFILELMKNADETILSG